VKYFVLAGIAISLTFCGSEPSPLEKMTPPIRVVRNDSVTQVEDMNGRMYVLSLDERTIHGAIFIALGDTLIHK